MDNTEKEKMISFVRNQNKLYSLSRLEKLLRKPFKTGFFFALTAIGYLKPFKVSKKTFWGTKMSYYLPEGNALFYYGMFEVDVTNFLIRFLKPGMNFIDCGANIGYYSSLAKTLIGKEGKLISIEPTPRTCDTLKKNLEKDSGTIVLCKAVSDQKSEINFTDYGPRFSAFNAIKARENEGLDFLKKYETQVTVKTITLDAIVSEQKIRPDIIKIDTEGSESLALKGSLNILEKIRPVLIVEMAGGDEWSENRNTVNEILVKNKYQKYSANEDGYLSKHIEKNNYDYENVIAIPEEKVLLYKELIHDNR